MCSSDLAHFGDLVVRYEPKDDLTPDRGTLSIEKARGVIGYAPQYPSETGFAKYVEWYRLRWPTLHPGAAQPACS